MDSSSLSPDVRQLWDEFVEKQDDSQYMRNVLSGLSGIMLVGRVHRIFRDAYIQPAVRPLLVLTSIFASVFIYAFAAHARGGEIACQVRRPPCVYRSVCKFNDRSNVNMNIKISIYFRTEGYIGHEFRLCFAPHPIPWSLRPWSWVAWSFGLADKPGAGVKTPQAMHRRTVAM